MKRVLIGATLILVISASIYQAVALAELNSRLDQIDLQLAHLHRDSNQPAMRGTVVHPTSSSTKLPDQHLVNRMGLSLLVTKITALEQRIAHLQEKNGAQSMEPTSGYHTLAGVRQARERDRQRYSQAELEEIEILYELGLKGHGGGKDSRDSLRLLVERFPDSNRGGCAAMNLGALALNEGDVDSSREYFEQIIHSGNQAVFDDGEPVLAKAMLNLGMSFAKSGDLATADTTWQELTERFPDQKDGRGVPYSRIIENIRDAASD
jgi:TolA-binding protein